MNNSAFKNLEEVVMCFYDSNNPLRNEAQNVLSDLQQSPDIWRIIWEDLLVSKRTELQFYGATVLHSKLLKDWGEIPLNQYDILKSKILEAIIYFKNSAELVHGRLCIALAIYIVRTVPTQWPTAVSDVINMFQPQNIQSIPEDILASILLEILSVIPEQFQTMILSKNERIFVRSAIEIDAITVLSLLETMLTSQNIDVMSRALKCSKSWLEFGLPLENCDKILDILINIVMMTYMNEEISAFSISALEAISILCTHRCNEKLETTIIGFLRKTLFLKNIFKNVNNEAVSADLFPCLCTLFVELGETHMKLLIKLLDTDNHDITIDIIRVMLDCSNAPGDYPKDEMYSSQAYNFWYQLEEELLSSDSEYDESIINTIKPFYRVLVPTLLKKSMYPEDIQKWSKEDQDSFRCYRQDIADTFMYCYAMIKQDLVEALLNGMKYAVYDINTIHQRWRPIEAHLHAFYAIGEHLVANDSEQTVKFIIFVQNLPLACMNSRVSLMAMELIGAYSEWFCDHPEVLGPVLNLVLNAISNSELAPSATLSLKDIARECQPVIYPYAEQILISTKEVLSKKNLHHAEEVRLVFTIGKVLAILPVDIVLHHLELVVAPYLKYIQDHLKDLNTAKPDATVLHCINVFTQLFLSLEMKMEHPPIYILLESVLPIYKEILRLCRKKAFITAICTSLKCAVCNLCEFCSDLVPSIIDLLVISYRQGFEHSFLDVAKQILVLFGNDERHIQLMSNMLRELCAVTIEVLNSSPDGNISDHTSLLETFYQFCTNIIKKTCKLITQTPGLDLQSLFRYACLSLCLQEVPTVKSAAIFLSNLITVSREEGNEALLNLVQTHGADLVYQIIIALGKVSPRSCLEPVTDVLIALNKKYCDWLSRWLNEILAPDNFPSPRATAAFKKRFIKVILRERGNKRKVHEVAREFSFMCHGLIHKEYIEETTHSLIS